MERKEKRHDLVLIHGLGNRHKWSDGFLEACLEIWGSGHVFVIFTGPENGAAEKWLNGRKLVIGGKDSWDAGIEPVSDQAANLRKKVQHLQDRHGLQSPFSIIAHSMGGLVARQYIYEHPGTVAGLVTLGTPHHGSPLAESFQWVGCFLSATRAIEDLKPKSALLFNRRYPPEASPLAVNRRIHTIRGIPDGSESYGWVGELFLGWQILSNGYGTLSDGLVPSESAVIEGAEHIADFPGYDHYDLVKEPEIVRAAAEFLP